MMDDDVVEKYYCDVKLGGNEGLPW